MNFEEMSPLQRRLHNAALVIEAEGDDHGFAKLQRDAIAALQPNTQEHVAIVTDYPTMGVKFSEQSNFGCDLPAGTKLYTHQAAQRTQWQDLTVQEQAEATSKFGHVWSIDMIGIADAIGVKLREKNGHLHPTHGVKP